MSDLPIDLFKRIADRAHDPARRTHMAGVRATAHPLDLGGLLAGFTKHGAPGAQAAMGGALGKLQEIMGGFGGGMNLMGPGGAMSPGNALATQSQRLAPPPSAEAISAAGTAIGHALPTELRQLYAIGDGGFGPGEGLFPLEELVSRYRHRTDKPYGPAGQDWPKHLLPLFEEDPVLNCLDLDSGGIVAWDPEEIEDEDEDDDWQRSFKPEYASLAALMEAWLARPTFEEQHRGGAASN